VLQKLMDFDVNNLIGAGRYERSEARTTQRNGYCQRELETRLSTLGLKIPKLRKGSYFPAFMEPRKTAERALVAVVLEAWIQGVSTRKVDDLVQANVRHFEKPGVEALRGDRRAGAFVP
jgi:transposase-like protein